MHRARWRRAGLVASLTNILVFDCYVSKHSKCCKILHFHRIGNYLRLKNWQKETSWFGIRKRQNGKEYHHFWENNNFISVLSSSDFPLEIDSSLFRSISSFNFASLSAGVSFFSSFSFSALAFSFSASTFSCSFSFLSRLISSKKLLSVEGRFDLDFEVDGDFNLCSNSSLFFLIFSAFSFSSASFFSFVIELTVFNT